MKIFIFLMLILNFNTYSANIKALAKLYKNSFNTIYQPRFCNKNIKKFLEIAIEKDIDLENAYVLKVEGLGFLQTSGFFTRTDPNKRVNLGYFHFVLIADDYVFDFDLHEPLVLSLNKYIKLQFTPRTTDQEVIFGINYKSNGNPDKWEASLIEVQDFLNSSSAPIWTGKFEELY